MQRLSHAISIRNCLFACVCALAAFPAVSGEHDPVPGSFLIASRELGDPNFMHSIVLVVEADDVGTTGLIINRPTEVSVSELLPSLEGAGRYPEPMFFGGPVAAHGVIMLIRTDAPPDDAEHVFGDVYVSGSRTFLERVMIDGIHGGDAVRLYAGHAGWAAAQLDAEISRGDWTVVPASESMIFSADTDTLWRHLAPPVRQLIVGR